VRRKALHCRSGIVPDSEYETVPGLQRSADSSVTDCGGAVGALRRARDTRRMGNRFFVYILTNCKRGVLYVGVTNDLVRRLSEHKGKVVPGFTSRYGLTMLVYYEEYSSILEARDRERVLKRWRRAWKFDLIEKLNPEWRDLTDDLAL
jgi:putative endonuclease